MKSFRFENIWLLSHRDRRARAISFHPHKNLILGRNHTGKSSLIRALFETLGATPQGKLEQWDTDSVTLVEFSIDNYRYRALRQRGCRALFNSQGTLLIATSDHSEWSSHFAAATGFNLILNNKEQEAVQADPSCFFLPFYINQDGSWQAGWNTFRGMLRFSKPWGDILEYFCGVRPPEYYEKQAKREQEQKQLDELRKEERFLERARDRFGKSLQLSGPKINPENFELEIRYLTAEVTELNNRQELLRDTLVREQELASSIIMQVRLATAALNEYENDNIYLCAEPNNRLECPTCGAEHSRMFYDFFAYAEDARVLRDLVIKLNEDAKEVTVKSRKTQRSLCEIETNYNRITEILETRRGEFKFQQVVESLGAERAFSAFETEGGLLRNDINERLGRIDLLDIELSKLTDKKRISRIFKTFREYYASARHSLNLPNTDVSKARLSSRPQLSGSGGPRSMLAYYGALWRTCYGENASFDVPVVIDSPNQQGQDDINLPIVIKYIAKELPTHSQLIVGLETKADYNFDKIVELDEQYKFLRENEFDEVGQVIKPLLDEMLNKLIRLDDNSLFYERH